MALAQLDQINQENNILLIVNNAYGNPTKKTTFC